MGPFGFRESHYPSLVFEKWSYRNRRLNPTKHQLIHDDDVQFDTLQIDHLYPSGDPQWTEKFDVRTVFEHHNFTISFHQLVMLKLVLPLRAIFFDSANDPNLARCYDINVTIEYDASGHDATIVVDLGIDKLIRKCASVEMKQDDSDSDSYDIHPASSPLLKVLNWIVIVFCLMSILLCIRSIYRGQLLRLETEHFFDQVRVARTKSLNRIMINFEPKLN